MGRRRRGEVDGEGHGAAEGRAEMLVALIIAAEHLRAADLFRLLHFCCDEIGSTVLAVVVRRTEEKLKFY